MYRILLANVWRATEDETSSRGYVGDVFKQLATEYESGKLVSYMTDEKLADLLMVTERHVRTLRKQLIELGLVKAKKSDFGGWFYQVGKLVEPETYGTIHEVLFIDSWLSQVERTKGDKDYIPPFELKLLELNKKDPKEIYGRTVKDSERLSLFLDDGGNEVPESRNYSSKTLSRENPVLNEEIKENHTGTNTISKIHPLPSEELYNSKEKNEKRLSKTHGLNPVRDGRGSGEIQPLFSEDVTASNKENDYRNLLERYLRENKPVKIRTTVTNIYKDLGYDSTLTIFRDAAINAYKVSFAKVSSLTEIWEKIAYNQPGLFPVRIFLSNWWVFYLLDRKKTGNVSFSIKTINSVSKNFEESITSSTDEVVELLSIIRDAAKRKGSGIVFAEISHLYNALKTTKIYNDASKTSKQSSKLPSKKPKKVSSTDKCPHHDVDKVRKMSVEDIVDIIKRGEYSPEIMRYMDDGVRLELWFRGYVDSMFMAKNVTITDENKKCWSKAYEHINSRYYSMIPRLIDELENTGEFADDPRDLVPHAWYKLAMFMYAKQLHGRSYTYDDFINEYGPAFSFNVQDIDVPEDIKNYYTAENRLKILKKLGNCSDDIIIPCRDEKNGV